MAASRGRPQRVDGCQGGASLLAGRLRGGWAPQGRRSRRGPSLPPFDPAFPAFEASFPELQAPPQLPQPAGVHGAPRPAGLRLLGRTCAWLRTRAEQRAAIYAPRVGRPQQQPCGAVLHDV